MITQKYKTVAIFLQIYRNILINFKTYQNKFIFSETTGTEMSDTSTTCNWNSIEIS